MWHSSRAGKAPGGFTGSAFGANWGADGVTVAALDGDGKPDLAATNRFSGDVTLLRQR